MDLIQRDEGIRKLIIDNHMHIMESGNEKEDKIAYLENDGGGILQ
jgi:predicted urease superfamily metal-dependent hydrolase